jgi:hypothetical protein
LKITIKRQEGKLNSYRLPNGGKATESVELLKGSDYQWAQEELVIECDFRLISGLFTVYHWQYYGLEVVRDVH